MTDPGSGPPCPLTVISGGQTGVDRAAWDAARQLGLSIGGCVPRGRLAEDGTVAADYGPLEETAEADYAARTERNVLDADATLVIRRGPAAGGTLLTIQLAERLAKPCLTIDLATTDAGAGARRIRTWLESHRPRTLNVGGPRASADPGIYADARALLVSGLSPAPTPT